MGEMIITKDGKREFIGRDLHFQDLLRKYIGDDAADFYRYRIEDMENLFDQLHQVLDTDIDHRDIDTALLILREDVKKVRWDA